MMTNAQPNGRITAEERERNRIDGARFEVFEALQTCYAKAAALELALEGVDPSLGIAAHDLTIPMHRGMLALARDMEDAAWNIAREYFPTEMARELNALAPPSPAPDGVVWVPEIDPRRPPQ